MTRITPEQAGQMIGMPTNAVRRLVFDEKLPIGYSIPNHRTKQGRQKRTFYIYEEMVQKYLEEFK